MTENSCNPTQRNEFFCSDSRPIDTIAHWFTVTTENDRISDVGLSKDKNRVEREYIVILPDTEQHERVTIEIENVSPNVAFGEVTERHDYHEQTNRFRNRPILYRSGTA